MNTWDRFNWNGSTVNARRVPGGWEVRAIDGRPIGVYTCGAFSTARYGTYVGSLWAKPPKPARRKADD